MANNYTGDNAVNRAEFTRNNTRVRDFMAYRRFTDMNRNVDAALKYRNNINRTAFSSRHLHVHGEKRKRIEIGYSSHAIEKSIFPTRVYSCR